MSSGSIEILARGVCVKDGRVLLCRNRRKGHCYLPGGHVETGETPVRALRREILEEIGWRCRAGRFVGAFHQTFRQSDKAVDEISLIFELTFPRADIAQVPSQEKKIEFIWVPLRKLRVSTLLPVRLRTLLPAWFAHRAGGSYAE